MVGPREVIGFIARNSKRVAVSIVGGAFVVLGIVMLVLPGPGIIVLAVGFAILGTEYVWAAVALEKSKQAAAKAGQIAKETAGKAGRVAADGAKGAARVAGTGARSVSRFGRRNRG